MLLNLNIMAFFLEMLEIYMSSWLEVSIDFLKAILQRLAGKQDLTSYLVPI